MFTTIWISKTQLLTYENGENRVNLSIVQPGGTDKVEEGNAATAQAPVSTTPSHVQGVWKRDDTGQIVNEPRR